MAHTVASAAINTPRDAHYVLANDAITYRTLLLEGQSTNLILQAEDFGVTWTVVGTATRTAAAIPASVMGVALDLIGDNDAAVFVQYHQTITFTADGVKALSVFQKQGPTPASAGNSIALWDNTASAYRVLATVTWTAGVPSVATTTGTYLGSIAYANGVYRFLFASTSVTAANSNRVIIYPANTTAVTQIGDVYAGGVQAENSLVPTSYVKTTTATVTRSADSLYFPFTAAPQEMTVYIKTIELGTTAGTVLGAYQIGNAGSTGARLEIFSQASGLYRGYHHNGTAAVTSDATVDPAYGAVVELRHTLSAAGVTQLHQSIDGAAEVSGAASAANALATAWSDTRLYANSLGSASVGFSGVIAIKTARGIKTREQMRAA